MPIPFSLWAVSQAGVPVLAKFFYYLLCQLKKISELKLHAKQLTKERIQNQDVALLCKCGKTTVEKMKWVARPGSVGNEIENVISVCDHSSANVTFHLEVFASLC